MRVETWCTTTRLVGWVEVGAGGHVGGAGGGALGRGRDVAAGGGGVLSGGVRLETKERRGAFIRFFVFLELNSLDFL